MWLDKNNAVFNFRSLFEMYFLDALQSGDEAA